jgi:S1-C subfamily serine protease
MVKIGRLEDATRILASAIKERLGITARPVTSKEAEKYGLESNQGVVIATVEPKGPLGEAGFEIGDIILGIDGQPIQGMEGFVGLVSALKPQQKIALIALDHRTGNTGSVEATVR